VNSRECCEEIGNFLDFHGFRVGSIHGGKSQKERESIFGDFVDGMIDIIVATDILSRGIDIENVDQVVDFEVPNDIGTYLHRIEWTGRAGGIGTAISFVTKEESKIMFDLVRMLQRGLHRIALDTDPRVMTESEL
jgi:superfamily II DNA/RNA helicase